MNFYDILEEAEDGFAYNPFAGKTKEGEWVEGGISIEWLNTHFGEFDDVNDMIAKAETNNMESTVLYFEWLVEQGILN